MSTHDKESQKSITSTAILVLHSTDSYKGPAEMGDQKKGYNVLRYNMVIKNSARSSASGQLQGASSVYIDKINCILSYEVEGFAYLQSAVASGTAIEKAVFTYFSKSGNDAKPRTVITLKDCRITFSCFLDYNFVSEKLKSSRFEDVIKPEKNWSASHKTDLYNLDSDRIAIGLAISQVREVYVQCFGFDNEGNPTGNVVEGFSMVKNTPAKM